MKFATVCTINYKIHLIKLIKSILKHNKGFDQDFIVFTDNLTLEDKIELKEIYDKFDFYEIDVELYHKYGKNNKKFYSFESFNLNDNKVIFMDTDLLCMGNIDELLDINCDIGMVKENRRPNTYNGGFIIIGEKYLNKETYLKLLKIDYSNVNKFGKDQKSYNLFFDNITRLPNRYNVLISEAEFCKNPIFYHYIYKPNLAKGKPHVRPDLQKLWESI